MEAANDYNVSPIHLATRSKQEGMTNPNYIAVNGTTGYYNFYNIGAAGGVEAGMCYAKGSLCGPNYSNSFLRPWDSIEKAIKGGAEFISSRYISVGQINKYFEKFNVFPNDKSKLYTNQYMQNIKAPTSETADMYTSLKNNNLLNVDYNFAIPIYNNMPQSTNLPNNGDKNNYLKSIKMNGELIVGFDRDITEYNVYVSTTSTLFTATSESNVATIIGDGTIDTTKNKDLKINVIAENGSERNYIVHIIKIDDSKMTLEETMKKSPIGFDNNYISKISTNYTASSLINSIKKINPDSIITIKDKNNLIKSNKILATGDSYNISVNGKSKSYKIIIQGDVSGDGVITILDLLKIQKHLLGYNKLNDEYFYSGDTNNDRNITILDLLRIQKHLLGYIKVN